MEISRTFLDQVPAVLHFKVKYIKFRSWAISKRKKNFFPVPCLPPKALPLSSPYTTNQRHCWALLWWAMGPPCSPRKPSPAEFPGSWPDMNPSSSSLLRRTSGLSKPGLFYMGSCSGHCLLKAQPPLGEGHFSLSGNVSGWIQIKKILHRDASL